MTETNKPTGSYTRPENGSLKNPEMADCYTISIPDRVPLEKMCGKESTEKDYRRLVALARISPANDPAARLITRNGHDRTNSLYRKRLNKSLGIWLGFAEFLINDANPKNYEKNLDIAEKALEIAYDLKPSEALLDRIQEIWDKRMELNPIKHELLS